MTTTHVYFWQRVPRWLARTLLGSLAAVAVLGLLVGGLALAAQSAPGAVIGTRYSVSMHVFAMTAIAALSVGVAVGLLRLRRPELAVVVLIASVLGPMTLVAVPVRSWAVDLTAQDTRAWWHAVIGALLLALLSGWTWWVRRCWDSRPGATQAESATDSHVGWMAPDLTFLVVAALCWVAYAEVTPQSNDPALRAIVGWAVLAAGLSVAVGFARSAWWSAAALGATAVVLGLVFLAYSRDGGWPGVAGWEYDGMESPIITSVASTASLLAASLLGLVVHAVRRLSVVSGRVRAHAPA